MALGELLQCVDEAWSPGHPTMAKNVEQVQETLSKVSQQGYTVGPDLDRHITAVVKNSRAVASVSSDEYKEAILKECDAVCLQRLILPAKEKRGMGKGRRDLIVEVCDIFVQFKRLNV